MIESAEGGRQWCTGTGGLNLGTEGRKGEWGIIGSREEGRITVVREGWILDWAERRGH